jgi:hypothetical protein
MDVLLELMPDSAASAEERDQLERRLRAELREVHLHAERQTADARPSVGEKGDGNTATAVVLALVAPGGVLPSLVALVQDWLGRQSAGHRVSITIGGDTAVFDDATPEQQQRLIDAFVRRHDPSGQ